MGSEPIDAKPLEAPALLPLKLKNRLAGRPAHAPKYPATVHNLAGEEVVLGDPRATRALVALMNVHAVNGGAACHWGGPAALAEIMASIHGLMFASSDAPWHASYHFVNDAGHTENGVYALRANLGFDGLGFEDLRGFRSIESKLTGHGESHLNPEGVLLSNGPLSSAVGQCQGLAMADKTAGNDRVTLLVLSDGASMEGEAKEAFSAIPGLAAKGRVNPFVMVLSDNQTKLSGRIPSDSFDMAPSFDAMSTLGWKVLDVEQGHDLQTVYHAIESAVQSARADSHQPVLVRVKTIKGYGVKATEENASGGHGFPLKGGEKIVEFVNEIYGGEAPEAMLAWAKELRAKWESDLAAKQTTTSGVVVKKSKIQGGLADAAVRAAKDGYPVYSISSDVQGSTGIAAFQKRFSERFVEVGIAEANMVSVGAGYAKAGYIPIVDTFGQFGVTKGNLPITMAALSQAPVIAIFSHVGFQDAADGASHQATTYFAAVSAIPQTVVLAPSCAGEADALMYAAIKRYAEDRRAGKDGENYIFFVGRENYPIHWIEGATYPWGSAQVIREGGDVVLVGCGPLLSKAVQAGELLQSRGIQATVISNPFVNRVDLKTIAPLVEAAQGRLVTIEDHQATCGMGSQVSHALSCAGVAHRATTLGIDGSFGQSAYMAEHLYERHGLTAEKMAEAAQQLINR
jgi:transketolase